MTRHGRPPDAFHILASVVLPKVRLGLYIRLTTGSGCRLVWAPIEIDLSIWFSRMSQQQMIAPSTVRDGVWGTALRTRDRKMQNGIQPTVPLEGNWVPASLQLAPGAISATNHSDDIDEVSLLADATRQRRELIPRSDRIFTLELGGVGKNFGLDIAPIT